VHDKIREVAYERMGEAERSGLHRAAAEVIERGDETTKHAEMSAIGHHWEQAGEREKARACYLSAARISKSRYALVEAERLYRRTCGLWNSRLPRASKHAWSFH
jgi:predicted ATPase